MNWRLKFKLMRLWRRIRRQESGIKMIGPAGTGKTLTAPSLVSHEGMHRLEVDPALTRESRLPVDVEFPVPDEETRASIFLALFGSNLLNGWLLKDYEPEPFVDETEEALGPRLSDDTKE